MPKFKIDPSLLISLVSAVISVVSVIQVQRMNEAQAEAVFRVKAHIAADRPSQVLERSRFQPYEVNLKVSKVAAVWVEVQIDNTGMRTFSVEDVLRGLSDDARGNGPLTFGNFGYPEFQNFYTSDGVTVTFPIVLDPGHQARFLYQAVLPLSNDLAQLPSDDSFTGSSFDSALNSLTLSERSGEVEVSTTSSPQLPLFVAVSVSGVPENRLTDGVVRVKILG